MRVVLLRVDLNAVLKGKVLEKVLLKVVVVSNQGFHYTSLIISLLCLLFSWMAMYT